MKYTKYKPKNRIRIKDDTNWEGVDAPVGFAMLSVIGIFGLLAVVGAIVCL